MLAERGTCPQLPMRSNVNPHRLNDHKSRLEKFSRNKSFTCESQVRPLCSRQPLTLVRLETSSIMKSMVPTYPSSKLLLTIRSAPRPLFQWAWVFLLMFTSVAARAGEWITLQIPLTRSSHTFELWEANNLGDPTDASAPFLQNGYLDAEGNWQPTSASYATVQVERRHGGDFWLRDKVSNEFGPANQVGLINAQWRESNGATTLRYFSVPDGRFGHSFAMQYSTGETFLVTKGQKQGAYDENNVFVSYGYFEAWSSKLAGEADTGWRLIDLTDNVMGPVNTANLIGADWVTYNSSPPVYSVEFTVGQGENLPLDYVLHVEGGAAQTLYGEFDSGYTCRVTGAVGMGRKFWLVRTSDQARSIDLWMGAEPQFLDAGFPPVSTSPEPNWSYQQIYAYGYQLSSPWIIQNGYPVYLESWSTSYASGWNQNGGEIQMPYGHGYATVDLNHPVIIMDGSTEIGTGLSITAPGWMAGLHPNPPAGSVTFGFPGTRANHTMQITDSLLQTWNFTLDSTSTVGGNFGPNGEWVEWQVGWMTAPTGDTSLNGGYISDISQGDSLDMPDNPENWFVSHPADIKISATRFGHDLRVRTGNGAESPIQPGSIQGVWEPDASGFASFQSYGYFNARITVSSDLPWWIVDYSQINGSSGPQVLAANNEDPADFSEDFDTRDTDGDGWQDWYERLVGTDPNDTDTDNDQIIDSADPNPRALAANTSTATLRIYTPLE